MAFRKFGTGPDQRVEPDPLSEGLRTTAAQAWDEQDDAQLREENQNADAPPAPPEQ